MRLHIGELFWPNNTDVPVLNTKDNFDNSIRDVLVVGGGISGAISAYRLAREGYEVTLIDQNKIASGSTSANTGLIQYMSDKGVVDFIEQIGATDAIRFYRQSIQAVETLRKINEELESLKTDTFDIKKSIILATESGKYSYVKNEAEKQAELGFGASFLDETELKEKNIDAYCGLVAYPDIGLNPYGFVYRLIEKAIDDFGLNVHEDCSFEKIEDTPNGELVTIKKNGEEIKREFKKVLFATGYNPPQMFKDKLNKLILFKTYVTVSKKNEEYDHEPDFLVWEVRNAYTYFRQTFDKRYMIGGMDVRDDDLKEEDIDKNTNELISKTIDMIDDKDINIEPEYSYAAIFGESDDNIPYMGTDPDNPNLFVICGAGGNGTVYSTIASEMVLLWMKGEDLSEYEIFRLGR